MFWLTARLKKGLLAVLFGRKAAIFSKIIPCFHRLAAGATRLEGR